MANIMWDKNELAKIKRIILNRTSYNIDVENNLIKHKEQTSFTKDVNKNDIFNDLFEYIEKLLYIDNRNEIGNILIFLSGISADYDNPLHYGLISCLDKIDVNDHTYVFEILKEIISQYQRVISGIMKKNINNIDIKSLEDKIKMISSSDDYSEDELEIRNTMDSIFSFVPQLKNIPIFNSVIESLDYSIKNRMLVYLNLELVKLKKIEEIIKHKDANQHQKDLYRRIDHVRVLQDKRTRSHNIIHR